MLEKQLDMKLSIKKSNMGNKEVEDNNLDKKIESNMKMKLPLLKLSGKEYKLGGVLSLSEFLDYVFMECSNCVLKDVYISDIKDSKIYDKYRVLVYDGVNCGEIRTLGLSDRFLGKFKGDNNRGDVLKIKLVFKILELFVLKGLLNKIGETYFLLNTNRRLTWNNIKQLKSKHINLGKDVINEIEGIFNEEGRRYDIVILIKSLFWFLRKAVVDSILSDVINGAKKRFNLGTLNAVSVGSMKLSSDYDVSLDTEYEVSALVMKKYNRIIETIFKDLSSDVFDTNVYGVSFTKKTKDSIFRESHVCNNNNIQYMPIKIEGKLIDKVEISQVIWCYIKLLLNMNMILVYDDVLYDKLYTYLDDELKNNRLFEAALDFHNIYKSDVYNYGEIVSRFSIYMLTNRNISNEDYLVSNFISYVNYNGSETYLTSGAFLDVVINQQMCSNKDTIKITRPYLYFTSFIENMSDLLLHYHKVKYLDRARGSLLNLVRLLGDEWLSNEIYSKLNEKLGLMGIIQKKCEDEVYKCSVYEFMYICIDIIRDISLIFYEYMKEEYGKDLEEGVIMFSKIRFPDILGKTVEDVLVDSDGDDDSLYSGISE